MGSMLKIRKDTVRQVERSSLLGEPVVAIPIEVDENEKQTDAAHELHRLSQTPQVVSLLHVFFGQRYLSAENSGIELQICHLQARWGIFSVRKQGCLYSPGLRLLLTETEHDFAHTVEQRRETQFTIDCGVAQYIVIRHSDIESRLEGPNDGFQLGRTAVCRSQEAEFI